MHTSCYSIYTNSGLNHIFYSFSVLRRIFSVMLPGLIRSKFVGQLNNLLFYELLSCVSSHRVDCTKICGRFCIEKLHFYCEQTQCDSLIWRNCNTFFHILFFLCCEHLRCELLYFLYWQFLFTNVTFKWS